MVREVQVNRTYLVADATTQTEGMTAAATTSAEPPRSRLPVHRSRAGPGVTKLSTADTPEPADQAVIGRGHKKLPQVLQRYRKGLATLFSFYTQAQKVITGGREQTAATNTVNLAMFMKCCKDFGLLGELLSSQDISRTFKTLASSYA